MNVDKVEWRNTMMRIQTQQNRMRCEKDNALCVTHQMGHNVRVRGDVLCALCVAGTECDDWWHTVASLQTQTHTHTPTLTKSRTQNGTHECEYENHNEWCFYGTWKDVQVFGKKKVARTTRRKIVQVYTLAHEILNWKAKTIIASWRKSAFTLVSRPSSARHTDTHSHTLQRNDDNFSFSLNCAPWSAFCPPMIDWVCRQIYFIFRLHKNQVARSFLYRKYIFNHPTNRINEETILSPHRSASIEEFSKSK